MSMSSTKVPRRLGFLVGVVTFGVLLALAGAAASDWGSSSGQEMGQMMNCPLSGKWAISTWSGQDAVPADQALATCGEGAVDAAYWLDPQTQQWLRHFRSRPEISSLTSLDNMQAVITLGSSLAGTPTPTSTPTLWVTVDQPVEGATVDVQTTVSGRSSGLQPGKPPYIYVFVRPLPGQPGYWWAQNPVALQPDGTWTNTSYIGLPTDPAGTPFKLCAVISDRLFQPNHQLTDDEFGELEQGPSFCVTLQRR
jgi:hypothetical protein